MSIKYDAIVVGAGQAGLPLASRLSAAGWTVALVERDKLGGTCVNVGCTPTKALVASAHAAHIARRALDFGVISTGPVEVDMALVRNRMNEIVQQSQRGIRGWLDRMNNVTEYTGTAHFETPTTMRVGEQVIEASKIFLNVGARPASPNIEGIAETPFLNSSSILTLDELPAHLIVIGGGYIGLEFAQMYRRFGSQVTIVERSSRILPKLDSDISSAVADILDSEGIRLEVQADCIRIEAKAGSYSAYLDGPKGKRHVVGTHILMAVGRTPNTEDLGLQVAGIRTDDHGYIHVDDELRTNVEGIWALGDCNKRGAFTHTSYNDFEIVAANLLDKENRKVSDRIVAHAVYIDPPLAQVGLTEDEVRQSGIPALIGLRPMTKVGRAVERSETQGFMKVLVARDSKEILGATILGVGGDEAIHCVLTAMYAKSPATLLQRSVHIHPTVAELIPTIFGELRPLV